MKKGHFILLIILFLISVTSAFYFFDIIDFPDLKLLPYYAGSSLLRMGFAYFFALCFALSYGYIAATNTNARKIMMPVLDILQSVPILGFFPAAVLFCPGSIFTSSCFSFITAWFISLRMPSGLRL